MVDVGFLGDRIRRQFRVTQRIGVCSALALVLVGAVLTPAAAAPSAAARTCSLTWVAPGDGKWSAALNWSPARTPRADDDVCLPVTGRPTITVVKPDTVRTVATGDAVLAVSSGVTLTVRQYLVLDGSGTVRGGAVAASGVTVPVGASPALRGVEITTFGLTVSAALRLSLGTTLHASVCYLLASSIIGDADPGNLVDVAGTLYTVGAVTVRVPVHAGLVTVQDDSAAALPELIGSESSGTLRQNLTVGERGSLTLPYPVTTVPLGTSISVSSPLSAVAAASTGGPAFAGLTTVRGVLELGGPAAFTDPLAIEGGSLHLLAQTTVTTPALSVTGGFGKVTVDRRAVLRLGPDGKGVFTDSGSPSGLTLAGGALEGDLDQRDGGVAYGPAVAVPGEVRGDWAGGRASRLTFSTTGRSSDATRPTNLAVSGTATLAGTINLNVYGSSFPRGYREVLLTAAGGLTIDPSTTLTTSSRGWHLTVEGTSIVATYRVAADSPSVGVPTP